MIRVTSVLTEPVLRSFLFKGAGVCAKDLEAGAVAAFNVVTPILVQGSSTSKTLAERVDPTLMRQVKDREYMASLVHSEAISSRVSYVNMIVGAKRFDFKACNYDWRVGVGHHLHVLGTQNDRPETRNWQLYSSKAGVILSRGLTAQVEVELECEEALAATESGLLECH